MTDTTTTDRPAPSAHMLAGNKGFGVSIDQLDDTLADYTRDQAETLRWWLEQAKERSWSLADLARQTGLSTTVLSRIYRGKYNADAARAIDRLKAAKDTFQDSAENPEFILTSLARTMFAIFDKCRAMRNVTILWGVMGIGKTTIMQEYTRRNNHGRTYYFRCPGHGPTLYQFTCALARALHISPSGKGADEIRETVARYLNRGSRLLIVDELHQIFVTCSKTHIPGIVEWLRQLQDEAECGLVLVGTQLLKKELFEGRWAPVVAQLVDRGTLQKQLPDKATKRDIVAFLDHYGLSFPQEGTEELKILNDIIAAHGLRKLTLHLRDGAAYAGKRGEPYAWEHFVTAHQAIQTLFK